MPLKLISDNFKLHNAKQFVESFTEPQGNVYYVYEGNSRPFVDDNNPPIVGTSKFDEQYQTWNNMIHGKRITSSDISHMVRRIEWTSGIVYDSYSHDSLTITTDNYFVASPEGGNWHAFKCLGNNGGIPSTAAPLFSSTSEAAESYFTNDGYQWKFLYTITAAQWNDFSTTNFMPVYNNSLVQAATVVGGIDAIRLDFGGKDYRSHASAQFTVISVSNDDLFYEITDITGSTDPLDVNDNFYNNCAVYVETGGTKQLRTVTDYIVSALGIKRITIDSAFSPLPAVGDNLFITPLVTVTGDGSGLQARAIVDNSTDKISRIEVIKRGSGYTYGTATIFGNTGLVNNPTTANATATVILGPISGHGSDNLEELNSHNVCIKARFSNNEGGHISATNDFREIGILKDPLLHDVSLTITHRDINSQAVAANSFVYGRTSNAYGLVTLVPNSLAGVTITVDEVFGLFQAGEDIYLGSTPAASGLAAGADPSGVARLATIDAAGVTHNVINNSVFDQRHVYNVVKDSGNDLIQDEQVWQDKGLATESTGFVHDLASTGTLLYLVGQQGFLRTSNVGSGVNEFVEGEPSNPTPKYKLIDKIDPQMVFGSGSVLYRENMIPITRSSSQKEDIKIVIDF